MKKLILAAFMSLFAQCAWAQCNGVFPPNTVCGNNTGIPAPPTAVPSSGGGGGGGTNLGYVVINSYGAIGDGTTHPLSSIYASLAAAQAAYPFVSDLTQEVDWAATQKAIDTSFATGNQTVFCQAVPAKSAFYRLSNPIFLNPPSDMRGQGAPHNYAAWASGTTYGYDPTGTGRVLYNGIPWASQGAGNKGNPPTAASGYPANLTIGSSQFNYGTVTITNASPAVFTYKVGSTATNHGFAAGQALIIHAPLFNVPTPGSPNLSTAPAMPTGLNDNQVYYVISTGLTSTAFEVSATPGGAAVNTSSAGNGTFTMTTEVWRPYPNGGADFSGRIAFVGAETLGSGNSGCVFDYLGFDFTAIQMGPENDDLVKNITIQTTNAVSVDAAGGTGYRCSKPTTAIGIGDDANNSGSSRTKFENTRVMGFYAGWESSSVADSNGTLGDGNTWEKGVLGYGCVGAFIDASQNEENSFTDMFVQDNVVGVSTQADATISGGNFSTAYGQLSTLTVSGVVAVGAANTYYLQATVTGGDGNGNLNNPMCAYNLQCTFAGGGTLGIQNVNGGNPSLSSGRITVSTTRHGTVPFDVLGYDPSTGKIYLKITDNYLAPYQNQCCGTDLVPDLQAQTTFYAGEVAQPFTGQGINANGILIEDGVPIQLISQGGFQTDTLKNIYVDTPVQGGDPICCWSPAFNIPTNAPPQFYTMDKLAFVSAANGVLILDAVDGFHPVYGWDRTNIFSSSGQIEIRVNQIFQMWNFQCDSACYNTGGTQNMWEDSLFGVGIWTNSVAIPGQSAAGGAYGGPSITANINMFDAWRSQQWGTATQWGARPASYDLPCITTAQAASLGSLPAITYTSNLRAANIVSGGTGYTSADIGDTLTFAGGTFTTAAQFVVEGVSGGAINALRIQAANSNSYTVEPSTFTIGSCSGACNGSGATFSAHWWTVNYTIGYPALWGGQIYRVCDYKGASQTKYASESTNVGYSYFQNLTTTNVPNLVWSSQFKSPTIYMNQEALELMFPGLVIQLTPTIGGSNCTASTQETFMVTEVHPTAGYVTVELISSTTGQPLAPFLPNWSEVSNATPCGGVLIAQQVPNLVNPY